VAVTNFDTINGQILAETSGRVTKNYVVDALGSVTGVSQGGSISGAARYSPYGRTIAGSSGAVGGWVWSWGYYPAGRTFASHYVTARVFDNMDGRWTTVDPLWPSEPGYAYVRGRAATLSDPSGEGCCCCCPEDIKGVQTGAFNEKSFSIQDQFHCGTVTYSDHVGANIQVTPSWSKYGNPPAQTMDRCPLDWAEWGNWYLPGGWDDSPGVEDCWYNHDPATAKCAAGSKGLFDRPGVPDYKAQGVDAMIKAHGGTFNFDICMRITLSMSCAPDQNFGGPCFRDKVVRFFLFNMTITYVKGTMKFGGTGFTKSTSACQPGPKWK